MKKIKNNLLKILLVVFIILIAAFIFTRNKVDNIIEENIVTEENLIEEEIIEEDILSGGSYSEELELEVEGFEESNPDMISGITRDDEPMVIGNSQVLGRPVYYSQRDSRWKNILYTSVGKKSQTIGSSGCGPTSAAMVIAGLKDSNVTPVQIADLFVKNGFRSPSNGTYCSAFKWIANKYNITFKQVYSVDSAIQELRAGNYVITSCSKGLFTTGGHYIVLAGIDGNTIKVYDPYLYSGKFNISGRAGKVSVSGNIVYCSVTNFKNYANSKAWFVFIPDKKTDQKYSQGQTVLIDVPIQVAIEGEWCLVDSNGYQFWVFNSLLNKDHTKIYCLGTIEGIDSQLQCYDISVFKGTIYETNFKCRDQYLSSEIPQTNNNSSNEQNTPKTQPDNTGYVLGKYRTNTALNVRRGPSTNYKVIKTYTKNTRFDTKEINGVWARTPSGWVNLKYCTLINKY